MMHESQSEIQSQDLTIKVLIRKKTLNLPTFSNRNQITCAKTDRSNNKPNSQRGPKISLFDIPLKHSIPHLKSTSNSVQNLSKTPTPIKEAKLCYLKIPGVLNSKEKNNMSSVYRNTIKSGHSTTRQNFPPDIGLVFERQFNLYKRPDIGLVVESQSNVFKRKITIKDLNLNLPRIIKRKKFKKRPRYKPAIAGNYSKIV